MNWVCRMWTETTENGWVSDFETFPSEAEAKEMGRIHLSLLGMDELSREYEVYMKEEEK